MQKKRLFTNSYNIKASQDHRGTPEAPGRVVTLIDRDFWASLGDPHASAPERVWGVAYRIEADRVDEVRDYLDIREINGYTIHYSPFQPAEAADKQGQKKPPTIRTLVYIGTPDNDQFTGPQDPQELAEHIYRSEGPSGLNREYLWNLEKSLDELMSPESGDEHVTDLSNRVRDIDARQHNNKTGDTSVVDHHDEEPASPPPHEFRKVRSVDEQEETE
ncbi:hypothetical protein E8E14_008280 [Neopestalotiopsis sp. 37M]|nr:hypothetical protein E8E14_008280 [Neopestalotiopsis sp. 37M]